MTTSYQPAFSGGIISPGMFARTDVAKYPIGLKDAVNFIILPQGGVESRAGTQLVGGWDAGTATNHVVLLPFELTIDDTLQMEFGDFVMRVLVDGAYVLDSTVTPQTVDAVTATNPAQLDMPSAGAAALFAVGDLTFFKDPAGTSKLNGQVLRVAAIVSDKITFEIIGGVTIDTTTGAWGTVGAGATLSKIYTLASPFAIADLPLLSFVQDANDVYFAHRSYARRRLVRTTNDNWAFEVLVAEPSILAPSPLSVVATQVAGTPVTQYDYKVASISEATGEESLPSAVASVNNDLSLAGNFNTLSWPSVAGAGRYVVYKGSQGVFGFISSTTALTVKDENILADTEDTPQEAKDPFPTANDQPGEVFFFEQRLGYANTTNNASEVQLSQTNRLTNFNRAFTPRPDDAIAFRLRTKRLNIINHVVPAEKLILFGGNAEWTVSGGDDNSFLTPSNPLVRPETFVGSADRPEPLLVDETVLFVQRDGRTLREFDLKRDDPSVDLTILARDLFRNKTIVSMAFARAPDSVAWLVMDDGTLLTMTYIREHKLWGWTRQTLGGVDTAVKWVSVVAEGARDAPYFVVSRTVAGQTITQVERLTARVFDTVTEAYFVDGGFQHVGPATSVLSGFLHMRGEAVSVLADGSVVEGLFVDNTGTIDFNGATPPASTISVGFGYEAAVATLPIDFGLLQGVGSSQGVLKAVTQVSLLIERTRGIEIGRDAPGAFMNQIKQFSGVSPQPLLTEMVDVEVEGDWMREASIRVQQRFPLPATINGLAPTWELGG